MTTPDNPPSWPPAVGVSGRSGSGKTLLIQGLVPRLIRRGLRVSVVKHCTHRIEADRPGKDTDRIFAAGADVLAAGPEEAFARFHAVHMPLSLALPRVAGECDVCLVEGYRGVALPRIQIADKGETGSAENSILRVSDSAAQLEEAEKAVWQVIERVNASLPAMALLLVGGRSRRMGEPKALLDAGGVTVLERIASAAGPLVGGLVLGGAGVVPASLAGLPCLPDVPGVQGPLGGILSALRWQPAARWLVAACDLPLLTADAVKWLLHQPRPGDDAICPRLAEDADGEPLFALYAPTARPALDRAAEAGVRSVKEALSATRVRAPLIPASLRAAWTNVNTPEEWDAARQALTP